MLTSGRTIVLVHQVEQRRVAVEIDSRLQPTALEAGEANARAVPELLPASQHLAQRLFEDRRQCCPLLSRHALHFTQQFFIEPNGGSHIIPSYGLSINMSRLDRPWRL